ncbi:MAG: hypothetical protein GYB67_13315, partial [Chloroflexi bacterium]|nr:hypothetical protein [Chloroflexota bacterium]
FTYRHLPMLSLNAAEFDFPHQPHPLFQFVGPMVNVGRVEIAQTDDSTAQDRLEALFARRQAGESEALIFCAFGAFYRGDDTAFWQRIIAAFADRPEWDVVLGLGGRIDPATLGQLPAQVHAFGWVPQLRVLSHADCAIIHGGITSMNECIQLGVPMLIYPFDVTDQHGSTARAVYHGTAVVGDRRHDDGPTIRGHIERILADATFKASVTQMRAHFERYTRDQVAERTIADLIRQGKNQG